MAGCPSESRESSIFFFYKQNLPVESLSKQVEDYSNVSYFESAAHRYISLLKKKYINQNFGVMGVPTY